MSIPDAVKNGQTTEIKNVQRLTDSKQLRLQKEVSNEQGTIPRIVINQSAKISKTLQNGGYKIETYNKVTIMPQDNTKVVLQTIINNKIIKKDGTN